MQINANELLAQLNIRLLTPKDAAARAGIPFDTLSDILGRRSRRDEYGLVDIGMETAQKLRKLLEDVQPIISLTVEPQGPPKRRVVPVDMQANWPGLDERLRAREERELQRQRQDPHAQAPTIDP